MIAVTIFVTIEPSTTSTENGFHLRPTAAGTCRRRTSPNMPRTTKQQLQSKLFGWDRAEALQLLQEEPPTTATSLDFRRERELFSLLSFQRFHLVRRRRRSH